MEARNDSKSQLPIYGQERVLHDCAMANLPSLEQLQIYNRVNDTNLLTVYGDWHIRPQVLSLDFSMDEGDPCECTCDCKKCKMLVDKCITPKERHRSLEIKSRRQTNDFWCTLRENLKPPMKRPKTAQENDFWSTLKKRLHSSRKLPSEV